MVGEELAAHQRRELLHAVPPVTETVSSIGRDGVQVSEGVAYPLALRLGSILQVKYCLLHVTYGPWPIGIFLDRALLFGCKTPTDVPR